MQDPPRQRTAAVVINPVKTDPARLRTLVDAEASRNGWAPTRWFETAADDDGRAAAREAAESKPDVVLVAGGDGTLRVVAEELRGTGVPVALLPSGTGNLFARNLGLTRNDVDSAVHDAFTGADRPIDVGLAELTDVDGSTTTHAFLVMAGVGLDASMAADTNAWVKKRFGWVAYSDPIARSIVGNRQIPVRYDIDGAPTRTMHAHTIIVGNCGTSPPACSSCRAPSPTTASWTPSRSDRTAGSAGRRSAPPSRSTASSRAPGSVGSSLGCCRVPGCSRPPERDDSASRSTNRNRYNSTGTRSVGWSP